MVFPPNRQDTVDRLEVQISQILGIFLFSLSPFTRSTFTESSLYMQWGFGKKNATATLAILFHSSRVLSWPQNYLCRKEFEILLALGYQGN